MIGDIGNQRVTRCGVILTHNNSAYTGVRALKPCSPSGLPSGHVSVTDLVINFPGAQHYDQPRRRYGQLGAPLGGRATDQRLAMGLRADR